MARQQIMPDDIPEISEKSKKNEILAAYQELLSKISDTKQESHQDETKKQQSQDIVSAATGFTVDCIVKNLADVKVFIGQSLDTLEQRLTEEYRRLNDIQTAIKLEMLHLEELHQIKYNSDSLSALLMAQKEYKASFEKEIADRKAAFDEEIAKTKALFAKDQEHMTNEQNEYKESIKKVRLRDEEQYVYALQLERKKDQDAYDAKKQALEKELSQLKEQTHKEFQAREDVLKNQEDELKQLRLRVNEFPCELEKAVREVEQTTKDTIERNYKYQMDIAAKEIEGERKLTQQMINSLQSKIKEQEQFIKQLTQKTDEASSQVQAIALKALENSSNPRFYGCFDEGKKSSQANL